MPARELVLTYRLAGSEARRASAESEISQLLSQVDYGVLERELASRRLLALIGARVTAAAGDTAPAAFRVAADAARRHARAHGLAVEWALRRTVSMLAERGIPALPLKGPTLALAAHGDLGLRETTDVDLLVPRQRLDDALGLLLADGYQTPPERAHDGLPELHWSVRHPRRPRVELHWRVHWYETRFSAEMLARARPGDDGLLRAAAPDLLAALLLFYARDGFHGLRLPADLAAWWDRHGGELGPEPLAGYADRYPELAPSLGAAAEVAEATSGVPALRWLGAGAVAHTRRVDVAVRLADWTGHGDRDQLRANISLVGGLLGPAGSARGFVRRELLEKADTRSRTALHCAKMAGRYLLALWSARGGRRPSAAARLCPG
jgi:hypothetical protein